MKHYTNNPRKISKKELRQLQTDLRELGDLGGIVHNVLTDEIIGGNQRTEAMPILSGKVKPVITQTYDPPNAQGTVAVGYFEWEGEQYKYRQVQWDVKTAQRANIRANKAGGAWDWDELANAFDAPDLLEWGFDADWQAELKADLGALVNLLGSEEDEQEDEQYSRKIEAPIYTPKGDKPAVKDLYNNARTLELLDEIEKADLPEDEKEFLRIAARRHTVLNFKRIAEYYAHSDKATQLLMENSALVIIDFNRAIELGYVKLSEEIAAQYLKDYGNA